jgi:diguanylate cyclase (GGDEF)-like protein
VYERFRPITDSVKVSTSDTRVRRVRSWQAGAHQDPALSPRLAALAGAVLAWTGAVLAGWSALVGRPGGALAVALLALASLAFGALVATSRRIRGGAACHLVAVLTTCCLTAAVASSTPGAAGAPVFYVAVALYCAYFLTRLATTMHVVLAICAFAAVAFAQQIPAAGTRVAMLAVALAATAGLLRLLRDHVFELIAAIDRTARTDALTGVTNRLGLDEKLDEELERAARTQLECAVLIGDLDHFKALNDRFGHAAGDEALRRVAAGLTGRLRRLDTVGRYGGDEFVVIAPATSRASAEALATDLAQEVAASPCTDGSPVAISFGVAICPHDGISPDELLRVADAELMAAKAGRAPRLAA